MMSRSRSTSLSDLLVCSAAYGFPFFGSSASSPSSRYRFTQADTRLCPTPYFLSISLIEICSSKCSRIKRSFSSLLHFRCGVPFFPIFLPPFLHLLYLTTKKVDTHTFYECLLSFYRCTHAYQGLAHETLSGKGTATAPFPWAKPLPMPYGQRRLHPPRCGLPSQANRTR